MLTRLFTAYPFPIVPQTTYAAQRPISSRIYRGILFLEAIEAGLREYYNAPDPLDEEFAFWQEQTDHALNLVLHDLEKEN